jgi:predicted RNA-binding protein associated with RNAse of E/G family
VAPHAPKVETYDVAAGTNTDPKGFVRSVDVYRESADGLYMARPMVDHPTMVYVRSWLLPAVGIRVTDFTWLPGQGRDQDFYVDIADVGRDGDRWWTEDHYLDLVVRTGRGTELLDVDEYVEAVAAGLLGQEAAERALRTTNAATAGLAAHGHDLDAWLDTLGVRLDWSALPA